jgi:hypothetical protein
MLRALSIAVLIGSFAIRPVTAQSKDDGAVFDTSLAKFAAGFERSRKVAPIFLVFNETTVVLPQDLGYTTKDLPKELVDALLLYNSVPQSIGNYSPPSPFRLSSEKMLGPVLEIAKPGLARRHYYKWDLFHARFPEAAGVLEFASPAYSPDGNSALVYFWTGCGDDCASGYVYILKKSNDTWKVVQTFSPWVA